MLAAAESCVQECNGNTIQKYLRLHLRLRDPLSLQSVYFAVEKVRLRSKLIAGTEDHVISLLRRRKGATAKKSGDDIARLVVCSRAFRSFDNSGRVIVLEGMRYAWHNRMSPHSFDDLVTMIVPVMLQK